MMDKLSMSLGDIMAQGQKSRPKKDKKVFKSNKKTEQPRKAVKTGGGRGGGRNVFSGNSGGRNEMVIRTIKPLNNKAKPFVPSSNVGSVMNRIGGGGGGGKIFLIFLIVSIGIKFVNMINRSGILGGGSTVIFDNLVETVESNDLVELCSTVGEIQEVSLKSMIATGTKKAEVIFARQSDAQSW
jgi:hypothetical protein